ncbi:MAG: hypothetical protein P0Y56_04175 [Candidatus Andeanibacterium colombiense]|uniref:DUF2214 domain-containing protein n=1 Tax=Candidatus Andeanibacterium colombiense TaxID=3121345 RepID=A0AAJ5X7S2_9SPHN|nr:MAG: hypothetical protein P0Y56_04175 [Sphingomonadaceae bacterium]
MHSILFTNIENAPFSAAIASSEWMFPAIETVHVFAIVTVIGTIAIMDMRLLGLTSLGRTVRAMERDTIPITWIGFALAVITGALLFVSKATSYMANPYFLWKMGLMMLAGLNMAIFHRVLSKDIAEWDAPGAVAPLAAKLSGLLSLALWMVIPFCGRAIGFTLGVYY